MAFDLISEAILKFNAKPGMVGWIGKVKSENIEFTPESIDKLARIF